MSLRERLSTCSKGCRWENGSPIRVGATAAYRSFAESFSRISRFSELIFEVFRFPSFHRSYRPRVDFYRDLTYRKKTMKDPCSPQPESLQPDLRPVEGPQADSELAALAKALGHPARVQIVRLLGRRTTCVCGDIVDELPLSQSTVSQHLKVLKDVGIIHGEIDGPRVCYCLNPRTVRRLRSLVSSL